MNGRNSFILAQTYDQALQWFRHHGAFGCFTYVRGADALRGQRGNKLYLVHGYIHHPDAREILRIAKERDMEFIHVSL